MDGTLSRIEWKLQQLVNAVERIATALERAGREPAQPAGATVTPVELERIVTRLTSKHDLRALLENANILAGALRELGYPMPPLGFLDGNLPCVDAWRNPTLSPLVRDVSYRLYTKTARPHPRREQEQLCIRALTGTFADMHSEQQILSPDGGSHHVGLPEYEDDVTFWCWAWRRSRELYRRRKPRKPQPAGEALRTDEVAAAP